jgi:hypothetical protein
MTDESDIYWTFVAASKFGGSFYQRLGDAGLAADYPNKIKLINAFIVFKTDYGPGTRLHNELRNGDIK